MGGIKGETKMKKIEGQHGDLILEVINEIPKGAKLIGTYDGFVFEKGEGVNTHILEALKKVDENSAFEVWELNGEMYLKVLKETVIDHKEHGKKTLTFLPKKKLIEREFDYEKEIERRVID